MFALVCMHVHCTFRYSCKGQLTSPQPSWTSCAHVRNCDGRTL